MIPRATWRLAARLAGFALAVTSCRHSASQARPPGPDAGAAQSPDGATPAAGDWRAQAAAIERAEEGRRPQGIQEAWLTATDVRVRRLATRALSRVVEAPLDTSVEAALLRGLGDEDREVTGWAAYGLGWACKGREEAHVMALAARAATLSDGLDAGMPRERGGRGIDGEGSVLRAIGRCGGALAEGVLTGYVTASSGEVEAEEAAYALGSVAGKHALGDETMGALLDRALGDATQPDVVAALFPIGRLEHVPDAWTARVVAAARAALRVSSPHEGFAIRALEKTGVFAISDLATAVSKPDLDPAARTDAARALGRLGLAGHEALAGALGRMLKDRAILEPAGLLRDGFNVLLAVAFALGQETPKSADVALRALATLPLPGRDDSPALAVRVVALRCAAAVALARAAYDAEPIAKCDPRADGATGQRARLAAIVEKPLVGERRKAFRALAESPHLAVREAALEAVALHPELEESGRALLVVALGTDKPGLVATAAQAIVQHPERVLTLAASERRAALDPRAPPPTSHPAMDLPLEVKAALLRALEHPWREDEVETRTAVLDALVAVGSPDARAAATRMCAEPNVTVREHAARALRALGTPEPACPQPLPSPASATAAAAPRKDADDGPPLAHPTRVIFDVSGAKLAVSFEPDLAPLAARRFVHLARTGFFRGVVVHRVVPGYVVQFGDPGGDGYGGSGALLPCETSPVAFDALDVGVALAGRDTGSSQLFVTLARYPKLDGDYARIGRAEGDWGAVAEGDVIVDVKVEE
jgi:cyclophilin family peptidyl-prolyl cis-trans isomerase